MLKEVEQHLKSRTSTNLLCHDWWERPVNMRQDLADCSETVQWTLLRPHDQNALFSRSRRDFFGVNTLIRSYGNPTLIIKSEYRHSGTTMLQLHNYFTLEHWAPIQPWIHWLSICRVSNMANRLVTSVGVSQTSSRAVIFLWPVGT